MKKHNELSVLPRLDTAPIFEGKAQFRIEITNFGLGPAIIRDAKIKVNNKIYDFKVSSWYEIFQDTGLDKNCFLIFLDA